MTLRQAAEACGMPEGTFYAKAVKFRKSHLKILYLICKCLLFAKSIHA